MAVSAVGGAWRTLLSARTAGAAAEAAGWRLSHGGLAGAVGSIRTKKWKPFHVFHKKMRAERKKRLEVEGVDGVLAGESPLLQSEADARERKEEPRVATTPFQATRLMRAFDVMPQQSSEVRLRLLLNVDLTRESVRGVCHLPHGLQTKVKVLAFCADEEAREMMEAGADFAGVSDPVRRIGQGWLGFDRCLATPSIMPQVMKVAKVLGPRKLMPNPKSGTVVNNLKAAIREAKGGTLVEYRAEGEGELKLVIGDRSFSEGQILDNMKFMVQTLLRSRPRTAAGGGEASAGAPAPGRGGPAGPMIGALAGSGEKAKEKDQYFLEASLQLAPDGPPISVDPEVMMPASVGWFR